MNQFKQLALRALLTYFDTFVGLIVAGGILSASGHGVDVTALEQAAVAAIPAAISVVRNGLSLLVPALPSTLPPEK